MCFYSLLLFYIGILLFCSELLMNETNRCIVNFQFLLMAQKLYMFRAVFLSIIRSVISRTTALVQFHAETSEVNKGHWLWECNGVKTEI